ncbi:O-antigen ligase family protein [Kushneria phosphatilytica]|uniref:Uncharacterized protein n=1 Tax=Kushneria phosphatilytica TaxID=657387 RepID=A0A1S1NTY2_9GAMM|nr:O-antigen ligase family protein [Kushneria phosphatilytica]OHV09516.1 hypothetical protein BH688_10980 [Kushneria phosphatilytica]QEL11799.1 hypothetical protein FY550_12055 [Kushneria phosphatilytica]
MQYPLERVRGKGWFFWVIAVGFLFMPIADFVSVYLHNNDYSYSRVSLILRGVVYFCALIFVGYGCRLKTKELFLFLLFGLPVASSLIWVGVGLYDTGAFLQSMNMLIKVFGLFLFYKFFQEELSPDKELLLEKVIMCSLLTYFVFVLVGAIFSIDLFRSYPVSSGRAGYKGVVWAQNEASALFITGVLLGFYKIYLGNGGYKKWSWLLIGAAATLLLGTKAAIIGLLLCCFVYFTSKKGIMKALGLCFVLSFLMGVFALLLYFLNSSFRESINSSFDYFRIQFENYNNQNLISLMLSNRDQKLEHIIRDILPSNYLYLLLGGYPVSLYRSEIDFPDLVLLLGVPLFVVYLFGIFRLGSSSGIREGKVSIYKFLAFLVVVFMSNTSGHFLTSGVASPYLAFLFYRLR